MSTRKDKILIVEDDFSIVEAMRIVLEENEGYEVHAATNGQVALDFLNANLDTDLVTLDLMLPIKTGYEVLHDLTEQRYEHLKHIPILIVSVMGNAKTIAIQKNLGFVEKDKDGIAVDEVAGLPAIKKPFDYQVLVDMVKKTIEENRRRINPVSILQV